MSRLADKQLPFSLQPSFLVALWQTAVFIGLEVNIFWDVIILPLSLFFFKIYFKEDEMFKNRGLAVTPATAKQLLLLGDT